MQIWDLIEIIKSDGVNKTYFSKVRDQWNYFQEGKEADKRIVPSDVIDSWVRSREMGIDPYDVGTTPADPATQKKELEFFYDLRQRSTFFFENIFELFDHDEFSFAFGTKDGLTQTISSNGDLSYASPIVNCCERTVGTSSSVFAFGGNRPVIFLYPFAWRQDYYPDINCAVAPIHNEKNEIIGKIGLIFRYPELSIKAYHLISMIAKIFDSLYLPLIIGYENQIQQIINCLPQAIACLSEKDSLRFYNEKLSRLLETNNKIIIEKELHKHLSKLANGASLKKRVKMNAEGIEIEAQCNELQDELTAQRFRLIQFQDIINAEKYATNKLNCNDLFTFDQIIGSSPLITKAKKIAMDVANTSVPVLIYGESGTGKEMFAQAIHNTSPRRGGPFIAINCGAIPGELVESELFGYEEGSFTGALKGGKMGKIEAASGGTLFLDEIESMLLKDQIKLLRVLSTGKIQKIGSTKEIPVDIRMVSATKTDLLKQADEGKFREDLYYRISTFVIKLPPLRRRREDIIPLAKTFIDKLSPKYGLENIQMDHSFIDALHDYHWRGNVREMEYAIEHALIVMGKNKTLSSEHLANVIQDAYHDITEGLVEAALERKPNDEGLLSFIERKVIVHILKLTDGNISAAAEQLGISRRTIYNKLQGKSEGNQLSILKV